MTDCEVCCETFNKLDRLPVQCINQCGLLVCRKCVDTFVVSNSPQEPVCMKCKHVWSEDFLTTQMTKVFMTKKLKPLLAQRMFEVQQMRFPETQENMVRKREIARVEPLVKNALKAYHVADKEIKRLVAINNTTMDTIGPDVIAHAWENKREAYTHWRALNTKLEDLGKKSKKRISEYKMGCMREDCRGFLNSKWVCGLCELKSCKDCHEPLDEGHECDPGKIETVKLLKKDSKPCPKCSCFISKISGCDHMWCTNCNTGFSWKTGQQIDNSRQTNALYYQYMRDTQGQVPRNVGDIPVCEQEISAARISMYIDRLASVHGPWTAETCAKWNRRHRRNNPTDPNTNPYKVAGPSSHFPNYQIACEKLWSYVQVYRHMQGVELGRGIFNATPTDNVLLREQFLSGKIDKAAFMTSLCREANLHKKHVNSHGILQTWVTIIGENLRSLITTGGVPIRSVALNESTLANKLADMDQITKFTNEQFVKHKVKYEFYYGVLAGSQPNGVTNAACYPGARLFFKAPNNNRVPRFIPSRFGRSLQTTNTQGRGSR